MHANLPNILSLSRIPASLLLLVFYNPKSWNCSVLAAITVAAILITDVMDGKLARKHNLESQTGYVLDGLGDRAFHVAMYLIFYMNHTVTIYIVWLLVFREISIYAARLLKSDWLESQSHRVRAVTKTYAGVIRIAFCLDFSIVALDIRPWAHYQLVMSITITAMALVAMAPIARGLIEPLRYGHD